MYRFRVCLRNQSAQFILLRTDSRSTVGLAFYLFL